MPGGEETPTPEDSSLSVASLIAELDILQYRDAFASAVIDDERLRAIYKSGVDAVEEMIVATQLRGGSATKVRRRLIPKQVSQQSSASYDVPPISQERRKQHCTANKACEDPAEGETAHGATDDDSSARAPGKPKVVAHELTTLNGQMTVMTRADLEAALAHVRAAGDARNGVVVVEFSARWCGGCRKFAAPYEKLIKELSTTSFCAVDVDRSPELVATFSVSELPLFVLFRESEVFDNLVGGKLTLLRQKIAAAAAGGRTKGGGQHMGGRAHRRIGGDDGL
jgi:thiol-disulfide isomerase/thioredoxin